MENADTVYKLICIDVIDKKNHRSASDIDIGLLQKLSDSSNKSQENQ